MISGVFSVCLVVTLLLFSTILTLMLWILGMLLNQLQKGEAASRRVFAVIDLEPSIYDKEDALPLEEPIRSISFEDVSFSYPSSESNVLNNINFEVSSGEFLGVMGHTGAGKSTILKLIEKFYEPQNGKVLINGNDINDYSIKSVRSKIGFVSQDPFLFYGTIKQNVSYAREATDEEIFNALEMAGASEFISQLANGLDTMVGDRGVMFSGVLLALFSLARAM